MYKYNEEKISWKYIHIRIYNVYMLTRLTHGRITNVQKARKTHSDNAGFPFYIHTKCLSYICIFIYEYFNIQHRISPIDTSISFGIFPWFAHWIFFLRFIPLFSFSSRLYVSRYIVYDIFWGLCWLLLRFIWF